jgi:putative spermidine/putrescine transport system substrate-binding protein
MLRLKSPRPLSRRSVLTGAGAVAASTSVASRTYGQAPAIAKGGSVTVSVWGGSTQQSLKQIAEPVFTKATGAKVVYDIGNLGVRLNKLMAQRAAPPADVFFTTEEGLVTGLRAGVLMPARKSGLPLLAELEDWALTLKSLDTADTVAGVPYAMLAFVLAYNVQFLKDKPQSWADLWRPDVQGKIAMPVAEQSLMPEWLTIATELAGGKAPDFSLGFKKLAELRPLKMTSFWTDWAPLSKTGELLLVPEFDYYVEVMKTQGYPVDYVYPKEKAIAAPEYVGVVKGAKNQELAEAFLNVMLDAGVQERFAVEGFQGPTNKKVKLSADAASRCAYGPRITQTRFFDVTGLPALRPQLIERMTTEVVPQWKRA